MKMKLLRNVPPNTLSIGRIADLWNDWCTENKIKYTLAVLIDKTGANIIISFENLKDMVLFKLRWL
jgi:hypothetical protein